VTVRVLVADDQDLVRTGLTMILAAHPDIEVVAQAADGREAVSLAHQLRPDVCLFDIRMPGVDGIEATRQLAGPDVDDPLAIVVITTFDLDEYVHGALKAGARGFLLKDAGPELLYKRSTPPPTVTRLSRRTSLPDFSPPSPTHPSGDHGLSPSNPSPTEKKRSWSRWPRAEPTPRSPTSSTSASAPSRPTSPAS